MEGHPDNIALGLFRRDDTEIIKGHVIQFRKNLCAPVKIG
jgi:hypothetical protein